MNVFKENTFSRLVWFRKCSTRGKGGFMFRPSLCLVTDVAIVGSLDPLFLRFYVRKRGTRRSKKHPILGNV